MDGEKVYIAIDLKSFYASVECVDRGLEPLEVNLVVADSSRTDKTICLAVTPTLKAYGISGRARLFEVVQGVKEINAKRRSAVPGHVLKGSSYKALELYKNPELAVDYIIAPPRMARYIEVSSMIYGIYLKYISPEDIHVYSIDEVFIDATSYLRLYDCTAKELTKTLISEVLKTTGITATAGIGTNLYLCKIAMDIVAKHIKADKNGIRIAELNELSYRQKLWTHKPLTDFWRVGRGISKRLSAYGIYTMGDIARCSMGKPADFYNEELLYRLFGINAELLIDHAWGYEPCTISDIKSYVPESSSLSSGQVLTEPYTFEKAKIVIREMTDALALELVEKGLVCDQLVLTVGYDTENAKDKEIMKSYRGELTVDHYGRVIPKSAHGSINTGAYTASSARLLAAVTELFDNIVDRKLLIRRMCVVANHTAGKSTAQEKNAFRQIGLFDVEADRLKNIDISGDIDTEKDTRIQESILSIKKRYGKNAVLRGMNFLEGATARERNAQIGGHKA